MDNTWSKSLHKTVKYNLYNNNYFTLISKVTGDYFYSYTVTRGII